MRRVARWILVLGLLLGVCLWLRHHLQPLATLELPAGTKLYLNRITIGRVHTFKTPPSDRLSLWKRLHYRFKKPNGRITSEGDWESVVFFFTSSERPRT